MPKTQLCRIIQQILTLHINKYRLPDSWVKNDWLVRLWQQVWWFPLILNVTWSKLQATWPQNILSGTLTWYKRKKLLHQKNHNESKTDHWSKESDVYNRREDTVMTTQKKYIYICLPCVYYKTIPQVIKGAHKILEKIMHRKIFIRFTECKC